MSEWCFPTSNIASTSSSVLPFVSTQNSACDGVSGYRGRDDFIAYYDCKYNDVLASINNVHLPTDFLQGDWHDKYQ